MTQPGALLLLALFSILPNIAFTETGPGMLQGIKERIGGYLQESGSPGLCPGPRAMIA